MSTTLLLFYEACSQGRLSEAEQIYNNNNNGDIDQYVIGASLCGAAFFGHLSVVKWLYTLDDNIDVWPVLSTSKNIEVVEWCCEVLKLSKYEKEVLCQKLNL